MSNFTFRSLAAWAIAAGVLAQPATAQQAQSNQQSSGDAPPRLEKLEEGEPPLVEPAPGAQAQPRLSQPQITEERERGRVTSIRVQRGGSTYYLKPNTPAGTAVPGDAQGGSISVPQWRVLEFDWGRNRDQMQRREEAAPVPAPPPADAPASAPAPQR